MSEQAKPSIYRGVTIFLILIFVVFAALQWNDPDPFLWVSLYLASAGFGVLSLKGWMVRPVLAMACLAYLVGGIYYWPPEYEGLTGNMEQHPFIELARESLGLLICAVSQLYFVVAFRLIQPFHPN